MYDEIYYYIMAWQWNGKEYEDVTIYETESLIEAKRIYNALTVDEDRPLIELVEAGEDEDKQLEYKEV